MTRTASFWTADTPLSWLAMYLLALPVFLLMGVWAALYLLLMGIRWASGVGLRWLEKAWE